VDGGGGAAAEAGREEKRDQREERAGVPGEEAGERRVWSTRGGWRYIGMYFSRKATVRGGRQRGNGTGKKEGGRRGDSEKKRKGREERETEG